MVCGISFHAHLCGLFQSTPSSLSSCFPRSPHFNTELEGWWGWRATKKQWKSLNQASKGNFSEEGAWILNRMKKSGEKACGGVPFFLWQGGFWEGVEEEAWWGEGLDTAISIWKVKACIDELNWAPWPPPPRTHTHIKTMCFVADWRDAAAITALFNCFFIPVLSQLQRRDLRGWSQLVSVRVRAWFRRTWLQNQWVVITCFRAFTCYSSAVWWRAEQTQ